MAAVRTRRRGVLAITLSACLVSLYAGYLPTAVASTNPDVTGKKYSEAKSMLSNAGLEPVVSTTVGDRTSRQDCLVTFTSQRNVPPPPNSRGAVRHQVLVSLNCDAAVASASHPGYSAQSPEASALAKVAAGSG